MPIFSAASALKASTRLRGKHAGRTRSKYQFEATGISVAGLPDKLEAGSQELVVSLSRGPKIAQCSVDVPGGRPVGGCADWADQKLSLVATLYSSKTGKSFSDKRYRATLLAAKPAAFGTSKRAMREIAHVDFNVADFFDKKMPTRLDLTMPLGKAKSSKAGAAASVQLVLFLRASHLGTADADDDDDDQSISSAISGFSGTSSFRTASEAPSEATLEQDLEGFGDDAPPRDSWDVAPESSAGKRWSGVSGLRANRAAVAANGANQAGGMSAAQAIAARRTAATPSEVPSSDVPPTAMARDMGAAALSAPMRWSKASTSSTPSKSPWDEEEEPGPPTPTPTAASPAKGANPFGASTPLPANNPFDDAPHLSGGRNGAALEEAGGEEAVVLGVQEGARRTVSGRSHQKAEAREKIQQLKGLREGLEERLQTMKKTSAFAKTRPAAASGDNHEAAGAAAATVSAAPVLPKKTSAFAKTRPAAASGDHHEAAAVSAAPVPVSVPPPAALETNPFDDDSAPRAEAPAPLADGRAPADRAPPAALIPEGREVEGCDTRGEGRGWGSDTGGEGGGGALASSATRSRASASAHLNVPDAPRGEATEVTADYYTTSRADGTTEARFSTSPRAGAASCRGLAATAEGTGHGGGGDGGGICGGAAASAFFGDGDGGGGSGDGGGGSGDGGGGMEQLQEQFEWMRQQLEASRAKLEASRAEMRAAVADRDALLAAAARGAEAAEEAAGAEGYAPAEQTAALHAQLEALRRGERAALERLADAEAEAAEVQREMQCAADELEAAGEEQYAELALQLVDAKLAAAQYAYERDQARQRHTKARSGGNQVAELMTNLEVKYEELKRRYDADMRGMIETKLQCAEACARVAELEEQLATAKLRAVA